MNDHELLMISGLQHFAFCRRQWALIHIEQLWAENLRTTQGQLMHRRAHDKDESELRGDILTIRGLNVSSQRLGVTGVCDVVEFRRDPEGVTLSGREGKWQPYPIEYKRGEPKPFDADELQLCAQAMCLEEMLLCSIPEGSIYYGETRRRTKVALTAELRTRVVAMLGEMREYYRRGYTPKASPSKGCNACSLKELCIPKLKRTGSVATYIRSHIGEED